MVGCAIFIKLRKRRKTHFHQKQMFDDDKDSPKQQPSAAQEENAEMNKKINNFIEGGDQKAQEAPQQVDHMSDIDQADQPGAQESEDKNVAGAAAAAVVNQEMSADGGANAADDSAALGWGWDLNGQPNYTNASNLKDHFLKQEDAASQGSADEEASEILTDQQQRRRKQIESAAQADNDDMQGDDQQLQDIGDDAAHQINTFVAQSAAASDPNVAGHETSGAAQEQFVESVNSVVLQCRQLTQKITNNQEPIQEIENLATQIESNAQIILLTVKTVLAEEQKADFVKSLRDLAQVMLNEQVIMDPGYLVAIFKYFYAVVVHLFGPMIDRLDVCQLVDLIFSEKNTLYVNVLLQPVSKGRRSGMSGSGSGQKPMTEEERKRNELKEQLGYDADRINFISRIQKECEWRNGLKQGDYLEALSRYQTPQSTSYHYIQGWTRAVVLEVEDNVITVGFLGRSPSTRLQFSIESNDIAPIGTFTDDIEWKCHLMEGDLIDACDEYGVWYKSTLIQKYTEGKDCEGNPIPMVHIACRYPDPEGVKKKDGVTVTGWLKEEFDLYLEQESPCIRPFGSFTQQYHNVGVEEMKYDLDVGDQQDVIFQTKNIAQYANSRKGFYGGISYVSTIIDQFGHAGGFSHILSFFDKIANGQLATNVEHIGHVMVFLARTMPFWHREFLCTQLSVFNDKFLSAMATKKPSNPLNQPHDRGHLNILINNYHSFLRRYYVHRKHTKMLNHLNSLIGCSLLRLENLEKRIYGIKLIGDQIGTLPYMDHSQRKREEIVEDLLELNAFEIIFSSKNYHQQIVQRAEDVLKLYAQTQSLTNEMIDLIWETRLMDDTACISVYSIIASEQCISGMQDEIISYFVEKIKEIAPASMQMKDLDAIHQIGKIKKHSKIGRYCADALWDIVFQQKTGYPVQVLKAARKKLVDLMRYFDTQAKADLINKCVCHVADPTVTSLQVLKVLYTTISQLPKHNQWTSSNGFSIRTFVTELVVQDQLIDVLLNDLEVYKSKALEQWSADRDTGFCPKTIETYRLFSEGYTHSKNLEERLNGIIFILESVVIQGPRVSAEQLQRLWNILVGQTKLPGDQRNFMRCFRKILQERDWLDSQLVCRFFEEKIEQNHSIVNEISVDGFQCIQTMFLYINEFENSINIIKQPVEENKGIETSRSGKTSWQKRITTNDWQQNNTSSRATLLPKQTLEFRVHKHPNQLRGIEIIWLCFEKSPSRDLDLVTQVINFLAQVYHSISRVLEDQRKQIYLDFVNESMQRLKTSISDENLISTSDKRQLVKNTMLMLDHSLSHTEVSGSACIRPHHNIDRPNHTIEEITVQSYMIRDGQPKYFQFTVDSSLTVWEFIDYIAQKLNLSPRKIKVQRVQLTNAHGYAPKKPEFNVHSHCMTMAEMKVENGEEFTIMRNLNSSEKVALTNPQNNELVPDVRLIFEQWFDTYARPKEDFEDAESLTEAKYMDKTSCVNFMQSTIKQASVEHQLNENSNAITLLYQEYDSDQDGRLTKADFLHFYHKKSLESPLIVWQNLEKHNVGKDLMPGQNSEVDLTYADDVCLVRSQKMLPRYFISANQEQFNSLFDLEQMIGSGEHDTMEKVWKLIGNLKTNPSLYLSLLRNEHLAERLGQPESTSNYRLLYTLQIIYRLMDNYARARQCAVNMYLENRKPLWSNSTKVNQNTYVNGSDGRAGDADGYSKEFPSLDAQFGSDANRQSNDQSKGGARTQRKKRIRVQDELMDVDEQDEDETVTGLLGGNQNMYNQQQSAQQAGSAPIALQDAETVDQEKLQSQQNDRFGNQMTHTKRQILSWKGEHILERFDIAQVTDKELTEMLSAEFAQSALGGEEMATAVQNDIQASAMALLDQLKNDWLIGFINGKGFSYLINIIQTITEKNEFVAQSETLIQKAEVNTLRLSAYLVKVILVSCFCSQTQDSNLAGNLQRKMSMLSEDQDLENPNQSSSKPASGNALIEKQENISNEFKRLTKIFQENPAVAQSLLANIDLAKLQDLLQKILNIILKKEAHISEMDRQVVTECLAIWVSCISFKNELLLDVYGFEEDETTLIVSMLIDQGLFSEMSSLRNQFKEAIEFMCFNVKTGGLPEATAIFFLRKLLKNINRSKSLTYTRTPEFFELLTKLLVHYFNIKEREPLNFKEIFEPAALIKDLIIQLDQYQTQELKTSVMADHTLVGIINLVRTLLVSNPDILDQAECSNIMTLLIKKCLFNQAQAAFSGHITSGVDLTTHQSAQINKCHTEESRNAAYSLLETVINSNSDPTLIQRLVEDFWTPFIMQLTKQKESGVAPQEQGRSMNGFAGLKNLGCICYMNSMLQQLFNVPSFRYSLLAADDRQPEDMQPDGKGRQVDNNSLHQWLQMFSFLQLTDRQEYNPVDFCFAFKEPNGNPTNVRVQQDAQEFLNLGFDRLENLLKGTPQKYICQNAFQGQMTSMTVCKNCGNINTTDEDFYTLQVTVKNQKTLQSSLESMIAGEVIEDYNCSSCSKKVSIEKKTCIRNLPNTLVVHLNRIIFDFDTMRNVKLNDKLEFPNQLNVRPFMLHQVLADMKNKEMASEDVAVERGRNEEDAKQDEEENMGAAQPEASKSEEQERENQRIQRLVSEGQRMPSEEFDYKLVGVVIHMGVADAGHYISYVNVERDVDSSSENRAQWLQTDKQRWLEFNDSIVNNFDFSQMRFKAFGEDDTANNNMVVDYTDIGGNAGSGGNAQQSHNAYMLVYEKAEKKPLRVVCSDDHINLIKAQPRSIIQKLEKEAALSCDGTAIRRDAQQNNEKENDQQEESKNGGQQSDQNMASNYSSPADTHMTGSVASLSAQPKNSADWAEEDKEMEEFKAKLPHSFFIYPGLVHKIYHQTDEVVKYDEETKEKFVEMPFHSVQKFIPHDYYAKVHQDNQLFLAEKQVFCTPFFKTSAQLIQQYLQSVEKEAVLVSPEQTSQKRYAIFQMLDKLIFDMLVNGSEDQQKNLAQMTDLLFHVIEASPEAFSHLVQHRILVGIDEDEPQGEQSSSQQIDTSDNNAKKQKSLDDKVFLDMLVTGKTAQVRELAEKILTRVVLILFNKLDSGNETEQVCQNIQTVIDRILREMLALIPLEVQKYWHKLGAFFNFFWNMVQDCNLRRVSYFVKVGLIQRLMDLTGRYNSQQEYTVPPFDKLVATVCALGRCQPMFIYLYSIPDHHQPTEDELRTEIANLNRCSPHYLLNQQSQQLNLADLPMMNSADSRSLAIIDKRSKEFFNIALKNTQESDSVAQLIGHLCYGNYEASRRFGKIILKGLNNTNELEVKPYVHCMMTYLSILDEYQELRVEWLMGIPLWTLTKYQTRESTQHKVGINRIKDIQDNIVEYQSSLFKTRNNFEEAVLTMIYSYRKEKFVRAQLALLEGITNIMAHSDHNNVLLKYILTMDPPAYSCRRYWDWIEPHIREQIQACSDNPNQGTELETCCRIYSNIEHIKGQFGALIDGENAQDLLLQGNYGRMIPDPYLMWQIVSDQLICKFPVDDNAPVYVSLHECNVKTSKSRPNGISNDSLQRSFFNQEARFVPRRFKKQRQSKASKNRGASANDTSQRSRWYDRVQQKQQQKKKRNAASGEDGDSQDADDSNDEEIKNEEHQDQAKNKDEGNQIPQTQEANAEGAPQDEPQNHGESAQEGTANTQAAEGDPSGEIQANPQVNMFEEEPQQPEPAARDTDMEQQLAEGLGAKEPQHEDDTGAANNLKNPYQLPDDDAEQEEEEQEVVDEQTDEYTLLVFLYVNKSNEDAKVTIDFHQEFRNQVNFRLPVTQFSDVVCQRKNKFSLIFAKNKLGSSWGPFANCFKVYINGVDPETGLQVPRYNNFNQLRESKLALMQQEADAAEAARAYNQLNGDDGNNNQDFYGAPGDSYNDNFGGAGGGGPVDDVNPEDFGKINCPACTFLNPPENTKCMICDTPM